MDVTVSTPRLSAYFAFGLQWTAQGSSATARAAAGRVIDVKAQPLDTDTDRRKAPPQLQRQSNIFLASPAMATYAPPERTGQSVRLIPTAQPQGQNLDAWA